MDDKELRSYMHEEHKLIMRILEIVEYANLQELKKVNKLLDDNGFPTKEVLRKQYKELVDEFESV